MASVLNEVTALQTCVDIMATGFVGHGACRLTWLYHYWLSVWASHVLPVQVAVKRSTPMILILLSQCPDEMSNTYAHTHTNI